MVSGKYGLPLDWRASSGQSVNLSGSSGYFVSIAATRSFAAGRGLGSICRQATALGPAAVPLPTLPSAALCMLGGESPRKSDSDPCLLPPLLGVLPLPMTDKPIQKREPDLRYVLLPFTPAPAWTCRKRDRSICVRKGLITVESPDALSRQSWEIARLSVPKSELRTRNLSKRFSKSRLG